MAKRITQDFDLVEYKPATALGVPTREWEFIKRKIGRIKSNLNVFLSSGFFFLGASLTSFYRAKFTPFPQDTPTSWSVDHVVAWLMVVAFLLLALFSFVFAGLRKKDTTQSIADVTEHMELIEQRYDYDSPKG